MNALSVKIDQLLQINMPPQKIQTVVNLLPTLQNSLNQLEQKFFQQSNLVNFISLMMEQLGFGQKPLQERQMILKLMNFLWFVHS